MQCSITPRGIRSFTIARARLHFNRTCTSPPNATPRRSKFCIPYRRLKRSFAHEFIAETKQLS